MYGPARQPYNFTEQIPVGTDATATGPTGWRIDQTGVITEGDANASTTLSFTILANVAAGSWILVGFGSDSANLSSVSCGGLTWTVVGNVNDGVNIWAALAYAYSPDQLFAGTTGTATYAASTAHKAALGSSFLANTGTSLVPSTVSSATGSTAAWTAGTGPSAATAGDIVLRVR
jgi:hypothetical protein